MVLGVIFSLISIVLTITFSVLTYPISPLFIVLFIALLPIFYVLCFAIYVILLFIFTLFINRKKEIKKPSTFCYNIIKESTKQLLFLGNVKVHFNNKELLNDKFQYVVVCNHISNFDPLILIRLFKDRLICVTKPENYKIPIAGQLIHKAGFISINRESAFKAVESINKAVDAIKKGYGSVLIYPEGTRSKTNELLPFHPGSFKICTKAKVPLIICSIKNANLIKKNFPFKRTHVYVDVIKIIEPNLFEEMNTIQLAELSQTLIKENLKKY